MGNLLLAVNGSDFIECRDGRRKTSMHAENFVIDDSCEGEVVENFSTVAPDVDRAVLAEAFIVESVNLGDLTRLVVTSDQSDTLWVADLKCQQKKERLDRVVATINEITHEEVVGVGALATDLEKFHQVIELTVNITTDLKEKHR